MKYLNVHYGILKETIFVNVQRISRIVSFKFFQKISIIVKFNKLEIHLSRTKKSWVANHGTIFGTSRILDVKGFMSRFLTR